MSVQYRQTGAEGLGQAPCILVFTEVLHVQRGTGIVRVTLHWQIFTPLYSNVLDASRFESQREV